MIARTKKDIEGMRKAGKFAAWVLDETLKQVKAGVSTEFLDSFAAKLIDEAGGTSPCLGYHGFPKSICTSINEVVCHGIPSEKDVLKPLDIINIDIAAKIDGYVGDTSQTVIVPPLNAMPRDINERENYLYKVDLLNVTEHALYRAISILRPGVSLREVGKVIEEEAGLAGFSVVKEFCGHGIGREMHEEPSVPHYDTGQDLILEEGMCLTIEPMINRGSSEVYLCDDGWTVKTRGHHNLSAQFEHTLMITKTGAEILTESPRNTKFQESRFYESLLDSAFKLFGK